MFATPPTQAASNRLKLWPRRVSLTTLCVAGALLVGGSLGVGAAEEPVATPPELVLQLGHRSAVSAVALSPDGQTLASIGVDRTLRFWNAQTGELQRVAACAGEQAQGLAFSPDGQWLASVSRGEYGNSELLLWEAHSGKLARRLERSGKEFLHDARGAIAFSPDSHTLAVAQEPSDDAYVVDLWDIGTGKKTRRIAAHKKPIHQIAFSGDGSRLATASGDGSLKVWDAATGQLRRSFKGEGKNQLAVAFSPDGKMLAGAGVEASEMMAVTSIRAWEIATGKSKDPLVQAGIVGGMAFSPDGKTLISGGGMMGVGEIQFWDTQTGKSRRTIRGRSDSIFPFVLSHDAKTLVTAGLTPLGGAKNMFALDYFIGDIQLWDTGTGKLRRTMQGYQRAVRQVAFTRDGKNIIEVGQEERGGASYGFNGPNNATTSSARIRSVDVWDAQGGKLQFTRSGEAPFALSPDNRTWAFVDEVNLPERQQYQGEDNKIHVRTLQVPSPVVALQDARSGRRLRTIARVAPQSLAFSPNSKFLAVQSYRGMSETTYRHEGTLTLLDSSTGKLKWTHQTSTNVGGNVVAFSPDGTLIANGGSTTDRDETAAIQIWSVATGKLQRTLKVAGTGLTGGDGVTALAFAPDGKTIVGRTIFGVVWWDVASGKQQRALKTIGLISEGEGPETGGKTPLAISPDGKIVATETEQRTIQLWDFQSGRLQRELIGHSGGIVSLAFSPDSQSLVSGSFDGTAKVWNVSTGQLRATLMRLPENRDLKAPTSNWIAFTPDGNYQSSPGASALIRWRVGDTLYPAETYKAQERAVF